MTIEQVEWDGVPLRVSRPDGEARSGVIVLHQAPGYSPQTEAWLERLADAGYVAVAPLFHHRSGAEALDPMQFGGDLQAFAAALPGDADALADVDAALRFLSELGIPDSHVGVLGFSYGGRVGYLVAAERELAGVVSYYSGGVQRKNFHGNDQLPSLSRRTPELRTPWLGLIGEQDMMLEPGELDEWEAALQSAPVAVTLVRYPGAQHAFDVDAVLIPGMPSPYDAAVAEDATSRTITFFEERLA